MEQFIGNHEDKLWCLTHCISDHLPVIMCTSISKLSHQNVQQCRHFRDQNVNLFSKALSESNITLILCDSDPNSSYQKLQKLYSAGKKNFRRKILISFLLIAPAKNIVSVKRLQLHHMLVFGYTLSHSHCSACFVLLYSWLNNRSIKLDNIFHFLKF